MAAPYDIQKILSRMRELEKRVAAIEKYLNQDDIPPELAEELARIAEDKDY